MKKLQSIINKLAPVISIAVLFLLWLFVGEGGLVPSYMLPSPVAVAGAFITDWPLMLRHLCITLQEAAYGLLIGIALAVCAAALMDRFAFLKKAIYPLFIITQTIPTIALAPLLVLWMGFGMAPKVTLVALTTFFPIAVSLLEGYASTDRSAADLLRAMGASRWQIFYHLEFPAALSYFFSGLKVSVSYAVVGAVISEWLGGFEGLGVYMTRVKKAYAFDKMFAVILVIIVISLLLMLAVRLLRRAAMPWEAYEKIERND